MQHPVVILGAGPAGLTAAYELSNLGVTATVLERDNTVGGLSRTVEYKGYLFDIGGHRFYTKVALIERMWREILGTDLLTRPRLSRIYYHRHFFKYPLDPLDVLKGLGLLEVVRCGLSYLHSRLFPCRPEHDFETWVANRFGRRLFEIFFKTYTEKVWGMPCSEIQSDWASQRIQNLSFGSVLRHAFTARGKRAGVKSLIGEFLYPRQGPGMLWSRVDEIVRERGCEVVLKAPVERIYWKPGGVTAVRAGGEVYEAAQFISSLAIRDWVKLLDPQPPARVLQAAREFQYRDFLMVGLILDQKDLFPDNWIYIHDSGLSAGRIQNFSRWSPEMCPDPERTSIGMEYFCFEDDALWKMDDADLIRMASRELEKLGLSRADRVLDGTVIRAPKAYPVYDRGYQGALEIVREFVDGNLPNLQLAGRNGMHRYNNQDHSMLTAICAARNILNQGKRIDLWSLNVDTEYLEESSGFTADEVAALDLSQPQVPLRSGQWVD